MNITVSLTDEEVKCLENDLMDVQKWVEDLVKNKVESCKKRMVDEWVPKLLQDPEVTVISASESELVDQILAHKNYKKRSVREEELKAKEQPILG